MDPVSVLHLAGRAAVRVAAVRAEVARVVPEAGWATAATVAGVPAAVRVEAAGLQ